MNEYLTIGEAAQRLNLQVDTVRRLERDGTLTAVRTDGKHRRFRADVIERYARTRAGAVAPGHRKVAPKNRAPRADSGPPRSRRERTEVAPFPEIDEWESSIDFELLPQDENELAPAPPPARPPSINLNRSRDEEASRLQAIKNLGLQAIPFAIPPAWRGRVIADLERFVSRTQFPEYLSLFDSGNLVRARVEEVLEPYHAELSRQALERAENTAAESRLNALKAHGRRYVVGETSEWEWSDATEARQEVEKTLDAEVEANWSERDVEDLTDDILDEFEEDDEDEEEDDADERDLDDEN